MQKLQKLLSKDRIVTAVLVVLNVVLFFAMVGATGLNTLVNPSARLMIDWGANYGPLTLDGQPWRLITYAFLHGGIAHLSINIYALVVLSEFEKHFGRFNYIFVYLLSATAGGLVSIYFNPVGSSVGASGAICGLFGFALSYVPKSLERVTSQTITRRLVVVVAFIVLNLIVGVFVQNIDNAAHFGGLAAGVLCGLFLTLGGSQEKLRFVKYATLPLMLAILGASYFYVARAVTDDPRLTTYTEFLEALELMQNHKNEEALPRLNKIASETASNSDPKFKDYKSKIFLARANALMQLKRYEEALKDIEKSGSDELPTVLAKALVLHNMQHYQEAVKVSKEAIKLIKKDEDADQAYNSLAWSQAACGQLEEALTNANKGLEKNKNQYNILDTRGTILALLKSNEKALTDLTEAIKLSPEEGAAYFHRAAVYLTMGDRTKCDEDLKLSLKYKYEPDPWEHRSFKDLMERRKELTEAS